MEKNRKQSGERFDEYLRENPEVFKELQSTMDEFHRNTKRMFEGIQEAVAKATAALAKEPESLRVLSDYGWYLPYDFEGDLSQFTQAGRFVEMIEAGKKERVDKELKASFDKESKRIESRLIDKNPTRAKQINAAIRAHLQGEYYLSIPVFFSLIDGICQEVTGYKFFKTTSTRKWALKVGSGSFLPVILEPLKHDSVVRRRQVKGVPTGLNRHDVLHGTSVDYGDDPLNSYKALSLLNYVGVTLREKEWMSP